MVTYTVYITLSSHHQTSLFLFLSALIKFLSIFILVKRVFHFIFITNEKFFSLGLKQQHLSTIVFEIELF